MSIQIEIDVPRGQATLTASGPVQYAHMEQAFDAMVQHADFQKGMDVIWDLRGAEGEFEVEDPQKFVTHVRLNQEQRGSGYRVAVVVAAMEQRLAAETYRALTVGFESNIRIFAELEHARQWLGASPG